MSSIPTDLTVDEFEDHVDDVDDTAELDQLEAQERAGKGRKGVLDAIADRRGDLTEQRDSDAGTAEGPAVEDESDTAPASDADVVVLDGDDARDAAERDLPGDPDRVDGDGPGPAGEPGDVPDVDRPDGGTGAVFEPGGPVYDVDVDAGPDGGGVFRYRYHVPRSSAGNPVLTRAHLMHAAIQAGYQPASGEVTLLGVVESHKGSYEHRVYGVPVYLRDYQPSAFEPAPSNPTGRGRTDARVAGGRGDESDPSNPHTTDAVE